MPPLKNNLPAELAAEDAFRKTRYPATECLWFLNSGATLPSRRRNDTRYKNAFYRRLKLLNQTFNTEEMSTFSLVVHENSGFGVVSNKELSLNSVNKNLVRSELWAEAFESFNYGMNQNWSEISIRENVRTRKKHYGKGTHKIIRQTRPLVGPMNFINHACEDHANCSMTRIGTSMRYEVVLKKRIAIGDELLFNYKCNKIKCLTCQRLSHN